MLNVIIATGRLVKDPELRIIAQSDTKVCQFTLAIDNTRKEKDGTRGSCFLDCILFNERADLVAQSLRKGSKVAVHGSLNQRNFERQDGSKGKAYEISVNSIEFLDPKPKEEPVFDSDPNEPVIPDDDIPFKEEETKPQEKSTNKKQPEPKFDPYTGKPLKANKKK